MTHFKFLTLNFDLPSCHSPVQEVRDPDALDGALNQQTRQGWVVVTLVLQGLKNSELVKCYLAQPFLKHNSMLANFPNQSLEKEWEHNGILPLSGRNRNHIVNKASHGCYSMQYNFHPVPYIFVPILRKISRDTKTCMKRWLLTMFYFCSMNWWR